MQSDWTVTQTLSFIADRYPPGSQQQALEDIRQKARSGEIKISGRRCAWRLGGGAIDVQVREEISALAWVDIALCRVADDWAAANANEQRAFQVYQDNKFSRIVRRTDAEIRQGIRAILPPKHSTELEGWCSLRIDSADVMAAFSKTSSPTVQENIAFLVNYMAAGFQPQTQPPPTGHIKSETVDIAETVSDGTVHPIGRRGRKSGQGSIDDRNAIEEMLALLACGPAISINAAARKVAESQPGNSIESTARRLRGKFAARYGAMPPAGRTWADVQTALLEANWRGKTDYPSNLNPK